MIASGRSLAFLVACALMAGCAHLAGPVPPALDRAVPEMLAEARVKSVAVARIEGGHLAWSGAWGTSGPDRPASAATLYNIASLSKPITAETVVRAASAGGFSLDEPMYPYWVDPDVASDPRHRLLTPRMALTHRTGFANWRSDSGGRLVFRTEPGAEVHYSGEGFEYLARFVERRLATPFEQLAERLVFRPGGMSRTAYTRRPWFDSSLAVPYGEAGEALTPTVRDRFVASDDVYTTAADYGRFLAGVARGQGLTPAFAADRDRIQVSTRAASCAGAKAATCPDDMGWGLGWDVAVFGPDRVLWHTGADAGTFTFAYVIPRTGEGAVILTNSAGGYRVVLPVLERLGTHARFLAFLRAQAG